MNPYLLHSVKYGDQEADSNGDFSYSSIGNPSINIIFFSTVSRHIVTILKIIPWILYIWPADRDWLSETIYFNLFWPTFFRYTSLLNSFEVIQHFNSTHIFIWVRKLDFHSLAETKNWSSWNEITATSGRLHPLRLQNKQFHTPRITDNKHTRQVRRIQE